MYTGGPGIGYQGYANGGMQDFYAAKSGISSYSMLSSGMVPTAM